MFYKNAIHMKHWPHA